MAHEDGPREDDPEDEMLVDYLLGVLPDEVSEPMDERSIADDEFASRLSEVETISSIGT